MAEGSFAFSIALVYNFSMLRLRRYLKFVIMENEDLFILDGKYHDCWWPGNTRCRASEAMLAWCWPNQPRRVNNYSRNLPWCLSQVFVASGPGPFRKPGLGMWNFLRDQVIGVKQKGRTDSVTHWKCLSHRFYISNFQAYLMIDAWVVSCKIAFSWMSLDLTHD